MRKHTSARLGAGLLVLGLALTACAAPKTGSSSAGTGAAAATAGGVPAKPSAPVTLDILDVAGNQKLTGPMVDAFVKAHPDIISSVKWESAGAPDLVGTIKPQVDSKNLKVDLVMTGTDGLSAGIGQNLWIPIAKDYASQLSNMKNYLDPAAKMQDLAQGFGVVTTYYPSGPLLQYDPAVVTDVPKTPEALLAWAKAPASSATPAPPTPARAAPS